MLLLKKHFWLFTLILITVLAALLRLPLLNEYPMDRDEFARVVPEFTLTSLIPPGIILLTKSSAMIFNYSDMGYRLPTFLMGIASIPLIFFLGKTFFSNLVGVISAFILAILLMHIGYSNQNKEYVPLIFFTILSHILSFKIIFSKLSNKEQRRKTYFLYAITSLLGTFFSSYFYILVITYQLLIIIITKTFQNRKKINLSILKRFPNNLLTIIIVGGILLFLITLYKRIDSYFGLELIFPKIEFIKKYYGDTFFFITQEYSLTKWFGYLFIASVIFLPWIKNFRPGAIYIIVFTTIDFIFVSIVRFSHSAFPLFYPRYHSFLVPTMIIMIIGAIGGLSDVFQKIIVGLVKKKVKNSLVLSFSNKMSSLIVITPPLTYFVGISFTLILWYYTIPTQVVGTNFKDAGKYLTENMKKDDTLVRLKNFSMDHKFNHVNHYIDRNVLEKVNYSVFPERTDNSNWYTSLGPGDEDEQGFSDYLTIERIRPSLRFTAPNISKLKYYGPFIKTRKLTDKSLWSIQTSTGQETARFAIDEDVNTWWDGTEEVRNVTVDLGKMHVLNSLRFIFDQLYPQYMTIWLSVDGTAKTEVYNFKSLDESSPNSQVFFPPTLARFIIIKIKNSGIKELNIWEAYEDKNGVNKEEVFTGESVVKYNFSSSFEDWVSSGVENLRIEEGELKGTVGPEKENAFLKVDFDMDENASLVNYINFAMRISDGKKAALKIKTSKKEYWIKNIQTRADSLLNYYSINLNDFDLPRDERNKIQSISLFPSDTQDAEFGLDFFALDLRNLPGIQLKDKASPNGFSEFIPYKKDDDYTFFQIDDKLNLEKGTYQAKFKIKVDNIDPGWKSKLPPPPSYKIYEYLEPKENSDNDILYLFAESTRGTFYNSPAFLNIRGEEFKEANEYYEFSLVFKSDGKEILFFQGFNPKNRRYPANLYITYPIIEKIK